jgi:hypothetical protein
MRYTPGVSTVMGSGEAGFCCAQAPMGAIAAMEASNGSAMRARTAEDVMRANISRAERRDYHRASASIRRERKLR